MEKQMTQSESLQIITGMIEQAKKNYCNGGSFYYLLWGWTIMLANFFHFYFEKFTSYEYAFIVWTVTVPAGILTVVHNMRRSKNAAVVSHFDKLYGQVWIAVGVGIVLSVVFMSKVSYNHTAIIMLLSGIGTFINGRMLNFTPLIVGGILLWITGIICFNLPMADQFLAGGFGILVGYLIPGYILKSREQ